MMRAAVCSTFNTLSGQEGDHTKMYNELLFANKQVMKLKLFCPSGKNKAFFQNLPNYYFNIKEKNIYNAVLS